LIVVEGVDHVLALIEHLLSILEGEEAFGSQFAIRSCGVLRAALISRNV
jgi:hypothetical protein